jgi:hypothetical protein
MSLSLFPPPSTRDPCFIHPGPSLYPSFRSFPLPSISLSPLLSLSLPSSLTSPSSLGGGCHALGGAENKGLREAPKRIKQEVLQGGVSKRMRERDLKFNSFKTRAGGTTSQDFKGGKRKASQFDERKERECLCLFFFKQQSFLSSLKSTD